MKASMASSIGQIDLLPTTDYRLRWGVGDPAIQGSPRCSSRGVADSENPDTATKTQLNYPRSTATDHT
ncbi:predicted protein [Aspergillus nidulans FGSC A4]|uniref:Uncharacterized protein n=1 Tax=Emericella nidulans (strain FGSC A4 / ATCC 38163 / CBS 112.46 / NRRL 194 / M139) TaxID=227321 RepID=Q5BGZ3_EMENI|nr:hypothetical protein [Aspergillus nidulans FGSC A4]EAA66060.1 predicted protein [Aspergillus nidulans FGSC A4]CBF90015.1 TPA: conserved hypothetical protein [Aspergillus nidulans FGSC A4]|eukprot:XP_657791.1 predicted protein [Aspergillus nidulans FGSC A4]